MKHQIHLYFKKIFGFKRKDEASIPAIFHITHYKSGSQWVLAILNDVGGQRVVVPEVGANHVKKQPLASGRIYPCVYLDKPQFEAAGPPEGSKIFIVIRDLRDTLVSQYFSVRNSHQIMNSEQQRLRDALQSMDIADGMRLLMEKRLHVSANIQKSWIDTEHLMVKYEDLNRDEHAMFKKIVSYCDIPVGDAALAEIVDRHSFEKRAGRKRGEENINSHHRKGIVGDWRNYFDPALTSEFKAKYGDLLIKTGYESDANW